MGHIFRWDSPFMQKIAMVGNLVILNILWVLCSVPVVTMGAATAAMYQTVFQYIDQVEDSVFKPFFKAFAKNFKQATLMWLPILLIGAVLLIGLRYLFAIGGDIVMWIVIPAVSAIFLLMQPQLLPQIARFDTKTKAAVQNAALLTLLHMPSAFLMTLLNILPAVIFLLYPVEFMRWLPLWVGIWFSLVAYMNGRMLLKIWKKHIPVEMTEEAEEAAEEIQ